MKELVDESKHVDYLQSMQKLDVKSGDVIVLRYQYKFSKETHDNIKAALEEIIKEYGFNGVHVMILEEGMEIGVLRKG